jgi:hypothetical protein
MKSKKEEVPCLYAFLYKKIREKNKGYYIRTRDFRELTSRMYRVPNIFHYAILAEMERYELLKRIDKQKIKILKNDCEKRLNELRIVDFWG